MHQIKQSYTSAAASLTGLASNVTGASWTLSANDAGDDLAHLITIRNDSATDHSSKTAEIVGTSASGQPQTETLTMPGASATVTSTKHFKTVTSVTPSATIGADTMDIGWAAASVAPWAVLRDVPEFSVGFGVSVDSGSPTYTVQHTYGGDTVFNHSVVAAKTSAASGEYLAPIRALRLTFAAAGGATLHALQAGG